MATTAFKDLGAYAKSYKELVEKNGMNLVPSILMALDKLDDNEDAGKRKALVAVAVAAITKWDADWIAKNKAVTDQKDKLARSQFAVEVRKMKPLLQSDALPRWWDTKPLAGKDCQPEKLVNIPDDITALQKDIEAYIKGKPFKITPKCKISQLGAPGKVLVLGNPEPAMYPNGKPIEGWTAAEILNDKTGKAALAKSADDFQKKGPQSKRAKPKFFYADDEVFKSLFTSEEAHCYVDDADNMFDMKTNDAGRILVNAYAPALPAVFKKPNAGYAIIHELFHAYEGGKEADNQDDLGAALDEGCVEYFAREFVKLYPKWDKGVTGRSDFNSFHSAVVDIIEICGEKRLFQLWFKRDKKWVADVTKAANALSADMEKKDPNGSGQQKTLCDEKLLEAFAKAVSEAGKEGDGWWDKELAGKKCQPEKLGDIPDDVAAELKKIEAYIKDKTKITPKCKIDKLNAPGKVLVLGNPEAAMDPTDKPIEGWTAAEILNDKTGKPVLTKSALDFQAKDPQSKRAKPKFFYAEDEVIKALLTSKEACCYLDDKDKDGGRILVSAYAPAVFKKQRAGSAVIQEIFRAYAGGEEADDKDSLGWALDEGCVEYFARDFAGKDSTGRSEFNSFHSAVTDIINACGEEKVFRLWFVRDKAWVAGVKEEADLLSEDMKKKDPKGSGQQKTLCDKKLLEAFVGAVKKLG